MQSQDREAVMHAGLVRKGKDPCQQAEVRKKIGEGLNRPAVCQRLAGCLRPAVCQRPAARRKKLPERQQIEGHAAELKGKIPKLVCPFMNIGQQELLPDLGEGEQDSQDIQKRFLFFVWQAAAEYCSQDRQGKARQEDEHKVSSFVIVRARNSSPFFCIQHTTKPGENKSGNWKRHSEHPEFVKVFEKAAHFLYTQDCSRHCKSSPDVAQKRRLSRYSFWNQAYCF